LNVREDPSTSGKKITEVSPGDELVYTEESGGWYLIKTKEGEEGWVFGDYTELSE